MIKYCECGCGIEIRSRFVHGHNRRGKNKENDEGVKRQSEKISNIPHWNRGLTKELDVRIANQAKTLLGHKRPKEVCDKIRDTVKKTMNDEKFKQYHSLRTKVGMSSMLEESRKKWKEARERQTIPIKDTSIEIKIQNYLKQLNINFFTHQYINIEHGYQCDIFIPILKLVIECDGNYWHKYPTGTDTDRIRTSELIEKGFKVLRLWESEIKVITKEQLKEKIFNTR